jgi:hypothetical protein
MPSLDRAGRCDKRHIDTGPSVWYNGNMSNTTTTVWVALVVPEDGSPIVLGVHPTEALGQLNCECEYDLQSGPDFPNLPWEDHPGYGTIAYTPDGTTAYCVQASPLTDGQ